MTFIFPNSWDDDPIWRTHIFQGSRYTTNYKMWDSANGINFPFGNMFLPPIYGNCGFTTLLNEGSINGSYSPKFIMIIIRRCLIYGLRGPQDS